MTYPDPLQQSELSVHFTQQALASDSPPVLLDCRELHEWEYCRITGSVFTPLSAFRYHIDRLALRPEEPIIVYCHHGVRSLSAVHYLRETGYFNSFSMAQGIDAWSMQIDTSVPRY